MARRPEGRAWACGHPEEYERYSRPRAWPSCRRCRRALTELERFFYGSSQDADPRRRRGGIMVAGLSLRGTPSCTRRVVVVGAGERLELWSKGRLETTIDRPLPQRAVAEITAHVDDTA